MDKDDQSLLTVLTIYKKGYAYGNGKTRKTGFHKW